MPVSKHWAFRVPQRVTPPQVKNPARIRNEIDAFILAALEAKKLAPSAEADRATLIRRVSLDLLGLPPSPQAVADFLKDTRPDAYEQLVEQLLASPHYGERGAATGSIWRATPTPTVSASTRLAPSGNTATG